MLTWYISSAAVNGLMNILLCNSSMSLMLFWCVQTFRSLLLKKCQDEFENRRKATEAFHQKGTPLSADEEEQRSIAKHKMLGNITFIGELGKHGLLPEKIIHQCIQTLLAKKGCNGRAASIKDVAEDLECLCQILKTVGRRLDTKKAKVGHISCYWYDVGDQNLLYFWVDVLKSTVSGTACCIESGHEYGWPLMTDWQCSHMSPKFPFLINLSFCFSLYTFYCLCIKKYNFNKYFKMSSFFFFGHPV